LLYHSIFCNCPQDTNTKQESVLQHFANISFTSPPCFLQDAAQNKKACLFAKRNMSVVWRYCYSLMNQNTPVAHGNNIIRPLKCPVLISCSQDWLVTTKKHSVSAVLTFLLCVSPFWGSYVLCSPFKLLCCLILWYWDMAWGSRFRFSTFSSCFTVHAGTYCTNILWM
jgi:hypothetical protein